MSIEAIIGFSIVGGFAAGAFYMAWRAKRAAQETKKALTTERAEEREDRAGERIEDRAERANERREDREERAEEKRNGD